MPRYKAILAGICLIFLFAPYASAKMLLADAQALVKQAPRQSLKAFEIIQPELSELSTETQIQWHKVAIESANNLLMIERSYQLTQDMYERYWSNASYTEKRFIAAQLGRYGSIQGDLEAALSLFTCSQSFSDSANDLLSSLNNLAVVYFKRAEWQKAKDTYLSGIRMAEKINNQPLIAAMSNNLGLVWLELEETEKAQEQFKNAYIIKTRLGNANSRLFSLHNLMQSINSLHDWQQWQLYFPLYKRMLEQMNLNELIVQKEWMLAYQDWKIKEILPPPPELARLVEQTNQIQNPTAQRYVNGLAVKMGLSEPIKLVSPSTEIVVHIDYLHAASKVCTAEAQAKDQGNKVTNQ